MSTAHRAVVTLAVLLMLAGVALGRGLPGSGGQEDPDTGTRPHGAGSQTDKTDPGTSAQKTGGMRPDEDEPVKLPGMGAPIKPPDVEQLRTLPQKLFELLEQLLKKLDLDAEELSSVWMSTGSGLLPSWNALSVRVRNQANSPASLAALSKLSVGGKEVKPGEWVKNHQRYLNAVAYGPGARMARLKGQLNANLEGIVGMAENLPRIEGVLRADIIISDSLITTCHMELMGATTVYLLEQAEQRLKAPRNFLKRAKRTIQLRSDFAKVFFEMVDPEDLEKELEEIIAQLTAAELVKGVDPAWLNATNRWPAYMSEAIAGYDAELTKTREMWKAFAEGKFYSDNARCKDLKPTDLMKAMDEVEQLYKARRTALIAGSRIKDEIEAARKWASNLAGRYLGESKSPSTKAYDEIRKLALGAHGEFKDKLLKLADQIHPDKEKALLTKIADLMACATGETFDGLLADLTGSVGSSSARQRVKDRFKNLVNGQNSEFDKMVRMLKDFRYYQRIALEDAGKIMKMMGAPDR